MKKVLLVVFGGWLLVGCAVVGPRGLAVKLEGPNWAEKILGVGAGSNASISVTNATSFYLKLIVLGEEICTIGPGATVYSKRGFDFDYTELPMVALVYSNYGFGDNFIGAAGIVLRLRYGYPESWIVRDSDIQYFGERPQMKKNISVAIDDSSNGEINFPRILLMSTTALQIVNTSSYDADVRVNGQRIWKLKSGDVGYREYYYPYEQTKSMKVDIVFSSNSAFVGYAENNFYIGNQRSPRAFQFVLNKNSARRR